MFTCRSNATVGAVNQTQDYFSVFEEVSKYNVNLNYAERLWAVRRRHLLGRVSHGPLPIILGVNR
jgi:hypothetical protein